MEENENENQLNENSKLNSAIPMNRNINTFSSRDAPPLFSTILTLYILILLYFPRLFFKLILSPVLILTLTLLLSILRFGATQKQERTRTRTRTPSNCTSEATDRLFSDSNNSHDRQDHKWACTETRIFKADPRFEDSFVEWNVRAPLEVIYEAYEEGEEEETEGNNKDPNRFGIERYPSLSLYYPESDSDCSSNGDHPGIEEWGWAWEEEDREGLIEIALDGVNSNNNNKREMEVDFVGNFHGEEEKNLIEIDISGVKHEEKWRYSGES